MAKEFFTTKERDTLLRSIIEDDVDIYYANPDEYYVVIHSGDTVITAEIKLGRIARWPSNLKLHGRKVQ